MLKQEINTVAPKGKVMLRDIHGTVVETKQETDDTWTLNIKVDAADKNYLAGQFLSIAPQQFPEIQAITAYFEHLKQKKEPVRAYSMSSAPHEPFVSITIKPEHYEPGGDDFPPILSPLLASSALLGRKIVFRGYTGAYILPDGHAEHIQEVLHLVSGSGIVPNFSMLKEELAGGLNLTVRHTMIYVNKKYADIIFLSELEALAAAFPQRFKLVHLLTREDEVESLGPQFFKGRPTLEFVKNYVADPKALMVFACGAGVTKWQKLKARASGVEPAPRFMEGVGEIVEALGVDKKRYKHEFYG